MSLGALYFALFCALLLAWARTNKPDRPFNLWRFYLVQFAATIALAAVYSPIIVYLVAYLVLSIFVCAHLALSNFLNKDFSGRFYTITMYSVMSLWYFLTALLAMSHMITATALIVLVPSILCTYTRPGQRVWSWIMDTLTG